MRGTSKTSACTDSSARAWNCFWRFRTADQPSSSPTNRVSMRTCRPPKLASNATLPEDDVAFSEVNRGAQHHELIQVLGLELLEKGAPIQYRRFRSHNLSGKLRQKY